MLIGTILLACAAILLEMVHNAPLMGDDYHGD
jgi:hypothetical protein